MHADCLHIYMRCALMMYTTSIYEYYTHAVTVTYPFIIQYICIQLHIGPCVCVCKDICADLLSCSMFHKLTQMRLNISPWVLTSFICVYIGGCARRCTFTTIIIIIYMDISYVSHSERSKHNIFNSTANARNTKIVLLLTLQ